MLRAVLFKNYYNAKIINTRTYQSNSFGKMFYIVNPISWVSNKIKEYLIKKYENEFSLDNFCVGANQALIQLTHYLKDYDFDNSKLFMTDEGLKAIKQNLPTLDKALVKSLSINTDDIYLSYPYKITLKAQNENLDCDVNVMFVIFKLIGQNLEKTLVSHIDMRFHRIFVPSKVSDWIVSDMDIKRLETIN